MQHDRITPTKATYSFQGAAKLLTQQQRAYRLLCYEEQGEGQAESIARGLGLAATRKCVVEESSIALIIKIGAECFPASNSEFIMVCMRAGISGQRLLQADEIYRRDREG